MLWLFIIIASYVLFAGSSLADTYILGRISLRPKIYAFYIGAFGIGVFLLAPFTGLFIPSFLHLLLALGAGIFLAYAMTRYFEGLQRYEPSRMVSAIGGFVPIFTFLLVWIFSKGHEIPSFLQIVSFLFLLGGSVLITLERGKFLQGASIRIAAVSAFFTALSFFMAKYVYMNMPFWPGLMYIRLGAFLFALWLFISAKEVRDEIFSKNKKSAVPAFLESPKNAIAFFLTQSMGAVAEILRNGAIFLAPLLFLPFIHALQGVEYVVLFLLVLVLSKRFPQLIKEKISRAAIRQKIFAIAAIIIGLTLLAFS